MKTDGQMYECNLHIMRSFYALCTST